MSQTPADRFILHIDAALRTVSGNVRHGERPSPADGETEPGLDPQERELAANLMRVNHCGEVCAQALYHGQALTAKSSRVAGAMKQAASEETDHLAWCEKRLSELDSRVSYLNPVWYAGSFAMGALTGLLGDRINLGFVAATEEEVCRHLDDHLKKLPAGDTKSRRVLEQMRADEARHASTAIDSGGARFPAPVKRLMRGVSRLMTTTTYRI